MRHSFLTWQTYLAMVAVNWLGLTSAASAGDFFVPVQTATAGSYLGAGLVPDGAISGEGMDDNNAGLKTALSNNQGTGFGMWLTDFFAVANGYADPESDAWIAFDFGEVIPSIDQLLIWNYNQQTATNRGARRVDITYSTVDSTGLGNLLQNDYILNQGTGLNGMPFSNDIPLGTPGVGISARSIRITADGGEGVGNFGNTQNFYGLSEARFYSTINPLAAGPRVWSGGSDSWTSAGSWDIPDAPVTNEHSAVFGDAIEGPATVFANVPVTVNAITFNNANSYAIAGNGVVNLATVSGNASIHVLGTGDVDGVAGSHQFQIPVGLGANTTVSVGQGSSLAFNNQIDLAGNMLTLSGAASINHSVIDSVGGGSIVAGGGSLGTAGSTSVASSLALNGTTLEVDVRNATGGVTSDQFNVLGSASLAGNIVVDVDVLGGFIPNSNIPILTTTGGITNNSLGIALTGAGASLFSGVGVVGNSLVLLAAAGLTGDYNENGVVDAADYTVWRDRFGTSNTLPNDPIGGVIGSAHYNQWKSHFGQGSGAGAGVSTVPEPTSAFLVLFGMLLFSCRSRK